MDKTVHIELSPRTDGAHGPCASCRPLNMDRMFHIEAVTGSIMDRKVAGGAVTEAKMDLVVEKGAVTRSTML